MKIIGLTGSVATGKSLVANLINKRGFKVLDADKISESLLQPHSSLLKEIAKILGDKILKKDGTLDREIIRQLIFDDPEKRKLLDSIMHPAVAKK